jgi:hypothetical protein
MLQKLIDGIYLSVEEAAHVMNDDSKYQKTLELVRNLKSGLID